jgi:4a-hydroxytetrahydrobiopterin dehydratase
MSQIDFWKHQQLTGSLDQWSEDAHRGSISRTFLFQGFAQAFTFMTHMAFISERMDHHPEWLNVFDRVEVTLTSHDVVGLTSRDIEWATQADAVYSRHRDAGA